MLRKAQARSRSTTKSKSLPIGVNSEKSTNTQSSMLRVGTGPANSVRARLLNPPTLYKVPHTKTNIISHANRENGSFCKCFRISLHLRSDAIDPNPPYKRTDVGSSTNTANNGKATADKIVTKARVGRTIHTPARFVQLVHAVIAPNDIYGRASCTHRNNQFVNINFARPGLIKLYEMQIK